MKKNPLAGCTFAILGDSYSTFQGYIPQGNACYYPRPEAVEDVLRVEDTWWHQFMLRNDLRLLCNESYSGATVCTHVRDGQPQESSFTVRVKNVIAENPDYIFVFGCTNDIWLERRRGQVQFENWTENDLTMTLPAYCYVLDAITKACPQAVLVCVINTGLHPEIADGMRQAGEHYGATVVELSEICKQNGHPNAPGMQQIAMQIESVLRK